LLLAHSFFFFFFFCALNKHTNDSEYLGSMHSKSSMLAL
jgi:hypothetical protein